MPWRSESYQLHRLCWKSLAAIDGRERERDPLLIGKHEHRSIPFGELARSGEMIGVNVGLQYAGNLPPVLRSQIKIHLGVKRGIDDGSFFACPNEVGKTAFASPSHLDHPHGASWYGHLGGIPGQAPGFHSSL